MSESRRGQIRGRVYSKTNYEIHHHVSSEIIGQVSVEVADHVGDQTFSIDQIDLARWHVENQLREEAQR